MTAPASMQLGETENARDLVPGDVATVDAHVRVLADGAETFDTAAQTVRAVRASSWVGTASDAFGDRRDLLPPQWAGLASNLESMGSALKTYASALTHAQGKAQDAIERWREGEQATEQAVTEHNRAADRFNAAQRAHPDPLAVPPVFSDPGEAMRQEAQSILDDAREALDAAGGSASEAIGRLPGARHEGEAGGQVGVDGKDPWQGEYKLSSHEFGTDVTPHDTDTDGVIDSEDDDDDGDGLPDTEDKSWRDNVSADVAGVEGQWGAGAEGRVEDQYGPVTGYAEGEAFAGVKADAGVGFDGNGVNAQAGLSAGVSAVGGVGAKYGIAEVGARGEVFAGAEAEGEVSVGLEGVHASGEAFAGAKAEGSVSGDVGGVGAEGTAEAWAGVGVSGDANFGYDDGEITIGLSGGVGLGIGGKLGGNITIDVPEVVDTVGDAAGAVGDFVGDAGDVVDDVLPDIDMPW